MLIPNEQISAIKKRVEAATPGPWEFVTNSKDVLWCHIIRPADRYVIADHKDYDASGEFIAHSREDIPALLSEREEMLLIFRWLLGEEGEFRGRAEGEGAYWWRTELRQRLSQGRKE